jgi:hypothetical protein
MSGNAVTTEGRKKHKEQEINLDNTTPGRKKKVCKSVHLICLGGGTRQNLDWNGRLRKLVVA